MSQKEIKILIYFAHFLKKIKNLIPIMLYYPHLQFTHRDSNYTILGLILVSNTRIIPTKNQNEFFIFQEKRLKKLKRSPKNNPLNPPPRFDPPSTN